MGVTVAGSSSCIAGASLALLSTPRGIDIDINQTLYVVDPPNNRVVRWPRGASSGSVVAGQTNVSGSATNLLNHPIDVKLFNGAMYIVEYSNYRVLKWPLGASSGSIVVGGRYLRHLQLFILRITRH